MNLKKFTLSLAVALMAGTSAYASNVAQGKTAYAPSGTPALGIDGNTGTRWESATSDNLWYYVDLGEATNIDHINFLWEGAYAKHYKIHVANEVTDAMTTNLNSDDSSAHFSEGWTQIAEVEETLSGFPAKQTVTPTSAVSARYVAIELIERGTVYGFSFWEFEVHDSAEDAQVLTSLTLTAGTTKGSTSSTYSFTVAAKDQNGKDYTLTDAEKAAMTLSSTNANATFSGTNMSVSQRGTYPVVATIGDVTSNTVNVEVVAEGSNLALNKTIASSTEGSHNPENVIDGNFGTLWVTDEPSECTNHEYDAEIVIDLGQVCDFNCIHVSFEGATSADYTVTFSTDNVTYTDATANFTVTNGASFVARHDWLSSEDAISARYVKFHSTKASTQYGTKVYEIEVYSNSKSTLSKLIASVDKECAPVGTFTFSVVGKNQYGADYDLSNVEGEWKSDGGTMEGNVLTVTERGNYNVYYETTNGLLSDTIEVTAVQAKGDNLALNRPVTVDDGEQTGDSDPAKAVDGVDAAASIWGAAEPSGSVDHTYDCWIVVELEKAFDLDFIMTSWEGANSCQYTVETSVDGVNYDVVGTYDKAAKLETRHDYFPCNGKSAKYVKVHSTKASTQYGTKLQELQVFDVIGTTSSVKSIKTVGSIVLAGDNVLLPEDTVEATVYSLNGATVMHAEGDSTISAAGLQAGVYVVKATLADGTTVAAKIVK